MRIIAFLVIITLGIGLRAQPQFEITELEPLPIPITNNAVVAAAVQGQQYVYSFGGITTGLTYANITQQAFRYNVDSDVWDTLPPLPDTLGKIAASASYVKGKIYIIGGYHVLANDDEISSNRVHIFDPETNTYLPDGAPVPIAIDDQVQVVWRDSLIYVIAGWSNTAHVTSIQIYNPTTNTWVAGNALPNTQDYKAFGASGVIIGDTIYYMGGARTGLAYPAAPELRKGIINPNDPTQISWSYDVFFNTAGYRMGMAVVGSWAVWVGGAATSYNYNASAYDGSGVVQPENRIIMYNPITDSLVIYTDSMPVAYMDMRGAGQLDGKSFITCGGILDNAAVSNRTYLYVDKNATGINSINLAPITHIYPNPAHDVLYISVDAAATITLTDITGRQLLPPRTTLPHDTLKLPLPSAIAPGFYLLHIITAEGEQVERVLVR